ncbi:uncharacterized protein LOC144338171 [Macaca mulatta]
MPQCSSRNPQVTSLQRGSCGRIQGEEAAVKHLGKLGRMERGRILAMVTSPLLVCVHVLSSSRPDPVWTGWAGVESCQATWGGFEPSPRRPAAGPCADKPFANNQLPSVSERRPLWPVVIFLFPRDEKSSTIWKQNLIFLKVETCLHGAGRENLVRAWHFLADMNALLVNVAERLHRSPEDAAGGIGPRSLLSSWHAASSVGGGGQGADNHCQCVSSCELSSCVGGSWGWVPEQSIATASLHFVLECFPKIQKVHTLRVFRLNLTQKAGCPVSQLTVVVAVSGQTQFAIIGLLSYNFWFSL